MRRAPIAIAAALAVMGGSVALPAQAQSGTEAPVAPPAAPSPAASSPAAPARASGPRLERVEILGQRESDVEARRQSTAAKIVIGREEIDRHGDPNVLEVLKRVPGVTLGGRPGRGGELRLRGMGSGYTQILINGERLPPGFSLDSLTPEQLERIEVLRAPTAETGARAIAGTINIILREDVRRRLNTVHLNLASEYGGIQPSVSWTRADADGPFSYNLSGSLNHRQSHDETFNRTVDEGSVERTLDGHTLSEDRRNWLTLGGRLQWRLGPGETLALMPFVVASKGHNATTANRRAVVGSQDPDDYTHYDSHSDSDYALLRTHLHWNKRLGDGERMELKTGASWSRYRNQSQRVSDLVTPDAQGSPVLRTDGDVHIRDVYWMASGKYSRSLDEAHSLSFGGELDLGQRRDRQLTFENGALSLSEFGGNIEASTHRSAAWIQDDWTLSPIWSAYAGLRWEGITTRSDYGGDATLAPVSNRTAVWTPLLHSVWKLDEKSRDQIRLGLTRSWRAPSLQNLVARPTLSRAANAATSPDRAGNPDLLPELATGIDLGFEHYLDQGGMLGINLFHRRIRDLIRTTTLLEAVSWSTDPRWVARPRNIGAASSTGIELEARGRLDEWVSDAPRINLRTNLSVYASRVDSVPGPDNRLDNQPAYTFNLGGDYRVPGWPLQLGGNLNWTPALDLRLSETQTSYASLKRAIDLFAAWSFDANTTLRLSFANLVPRDALTISQIATSTGLQTSTSTSPTYRSVALRLEARL